MKLDPGRLTCTNVTLKKLMVRAYDVKDYQVAGPDWMTTELYTIEARMPPDTILEDLMLMIQGLLAERFQLAFHRESREMPVYELVIGKSGAKLKSVGFGRGSTSITPGKLTAQAVPLRNFVEQLSRMLNRPVLDKTGLTGLFDFTLEWAPEGKTTDAAGICPPGLPCLPRCRSNWVSNWRPARLLSRCWWSTGRTRSRPGTEIHRPLFE